MERNILRNIIKGTSATTIGTIVTMGFHLLSIYFLARYLDVKEFGYYALIFAVSNLLNLFSSLGLEISIVKQIAEGSEIRFKVLRQSLVLKTIGTVLILVIFILFHKFYPTNGDDILWNYNFFLIAIFIIGSYRDFFYRVLQGLNLFKKYTSIQIISASVRVALIISFIHFDKFDFLTLLYFEIATASLSLILQIFFIPFNGLLSKGDTGYTTLLKFSAPLYINNLVTFAYDRIGLFIIGILISASSVAIFDVSTKIPGALQGIISSYILVFFPNISTLIAVKDNINVNKLINSSISYISFGISFLALVIFLWRTPIVNLLFSSKYIDAALPLVLMLLALLFRNLSNILGYAIVSAGYSRIPMQVNFISVLVGIGSNFLLISKFDFIGAVFSAILMNLVTLFQYVRFTNKIKLANLDYSFTKTILTSIILCTVLYLTGLEFILIKLAVVMIFLIVNYNDILSIKKLFNSILLMRTSS